MARPKRNDVDYFPHTVRHGKKMSYLEKKYGNDGYAVWFKLLEECGSSNNHHLILSDEIQLMFLSDRCLVSEERLLQIISDLIRLDEFDKELWEKHKVLFNEKFVESISDAYKKRSNNCITKNELEELLCLKCTPKPSKSSPKPSKDSLKGVGNTQSKVEYNKEKEINNIYKLFIDDVKNNKFDSRVEAIYMRLKIKKNSLTPLLIDFKNHIIEKNRLHKNTNEFFDNFGNWLNTQDRIGKLKEYKK